MPVKVLPIIPALLSFSSAVQDFFELHPEATALASCHSQARSCGIVAKEAQSLLLCQTEGPRTCQQLVSQPGALGDDAQAAPRQGRGRGIFGLKRSQNRWYS